MENIAKWLVWILVGIAMVCAVLYTILEWVQIIAGAAEHFMGIEGEDDVN